MVISGPRIAFQCEGVCLAADLDYTVLTPINRIVSAILLMALPFSQRGVLLFAIYLGGTGVPAYVLALAWCASSSTGHTKKTTANAMLQIGYCEMLFYTACCFIDDQAGVGNLISPQIWRAQYAPRYLVPWAIILASRVISPILLVSPLLRTIICCTPTQ